MSARMSGLYVSRSDLQDCQFGLLRLVDGSTIFTSVKKWGAHLSAPPPPGGGVMKTSGPPSLRRCPRHWPSQRLRPYLRPSEGI